MRIPIKIYKSFFGTLLSIFSLFPLLLGVGALIGSFSSGDVFIIILGIVGCIVCFACYLLFQYLAQTITEKKLFKKWTKELREKGVEAEIASSVDLALYVYNNNKSELTVKYIEKLNPQAGVIIRNHIAEQKALAKQEKKQKKQNKKKK